MSPVNRILLRSSPTEDTSPEMGLILGHALAMDCRKVVVARDLMKSSAMMKEALIAGLLSSGADVIDAGVLSAPALALAASKGDCAVYVTEYRGYGMISGYLLLNPDGSLFRKEQIRHLDKYFVSPPALPESGHLGHVERYLGATREYNSKLTSLVPYSPGCSVVIDCGCGPCAGSAPQVLNSIGADVLAINAQDDPECRFGDSDGPGSGTGDITNLVESNPGCIGISMNKIGTQIALVDEKGEGISPEQAFAVIIMHLKPTSIAIPMDTTSLILDAFLGKFGDTDADEEGIHMTQRGIGYVCSAVASGAEMGFYDGGMIFGNVGLMPDGIHAAAIIAGLAGNSSIGKIVGDFPTYYRDSEERDCSAPDAFIRSMTEELGKSEWRWISNGDAWRVNLDGGWFLISLLKGSSPTVTVTAESQDRAYLIGLMELAGNLVSECMREA